MRRLVKKRMDWQIKDDGCPVEAKTCLSAGEILATIFFNFRGILRIDFLHDPRTVSTAYYCQFLRPAKAAHRNKRQGIHWKKCSKKLPSTLLMVLTCASMKESLGWKRFGSNEEVEHVHNWLITCHHFLWPRNTETSKLVEEVCKSFRI